MRRLLTCAGVLRNCACNSGVATERPAPAKLAVKLTNAVAKRAANFRVRGHRNGSFASSVGRGISGSRLTSGRVSSRVAIMRGLVV